MPTQTWRQVVMAEWQAAATAVNAALVAAGVAPLVEWHTGEPVPLPTGTAPMVWWQWMRDRVQTDDQALAYGTEVVQIMAVVVVGGTTPAELMAAEAIYLPVIIAALEVYPFTHHVTYEGGDRLLEPGGLVSWSPTVWRLEIDRAEGAV